MLDSFILSSLLPLFPSSDGVTKQENGSRDRSMARTTSSQFAATRSSKELSNKTGVGKRGSTKERPAQARSLVGLAKGRTSASAGERQPKGQSSLLLSTTAQLRGGEQVIQQDAQSRAQSRARRQRQTARHKRQFEAVLARVRLPKASQAATPSIIRPGGIRLEGMRLGLSNWQASKIASALLLATVIALVVWVHSNDRWFVYREAVTFNPLTYVKAEDLYAQSAMDSWNIFWLSPSAIRTRLMALPTVADAQVTLQLPNHVAVHIQEEQPVALWVTQAGNFWVLPDGAAVPEPAEAQANLLQIIDPLREAKDWNDPAGVNFDANMLKSALRLVNYLPEVNQIYFNQGYGLNFHLPGSSAWVYWGDGLNMEKKYKNIVAVQDHLRTEDAQPKIIDLRFEKPVLK